jgi:hypothetical protein
MHGFANFKFRKECWCNYSYPNSMRIAEKKVKALSVWWLVEEQISTNRGLIPIRKRMFSLLRSVCMGKLRIVSINLLLYAIKRARFEVIIDIRIEGYQKLRQIVYSEIFDFIYKTTWRHVSEERDFEIGNNDMIYFLTAVGLSPGGSTHLHTNNI